VITSQFQFSIFSLLLFHIAQFLSFSLLFSDIFKCDNDPFAQSETFHSSSAIFLNSHESCEMTSAVTLVDSLIRDYLIFRGFAGSLKQFDADSKAEKEHKFKVGYFFLLQFASFCPSLFECVEDCSIFAFFLYAI
jgi:hypothetical protein